MKIINRSCERILATTAAALCLLLFIAAAPVAAQTTSTEVLGTVSDSTGAVIPGAKVSLLRVETGERRETTTTSSGDFSFPLIEIGEYTVKVTVQGFKTEERTASRCNSSKRPARTSS